MHLLRDDRNPCRHRCRTDEAIFYFFAFAKPTGSLPMLTEQLGGEVSPGEAGSQKIRAIELKSAVS